MTARMLPGGPVAEAVYADLAPRIDALVARGHRPGLGTILVGDDPASAGYIRMKMEKATALGLGSPHRSLPDTATQADLVAAIRELEEELGITGAQLRPLLTDWYSDEATRQLCYAYETTYDRPVRHQEAEIDWGGWLTIDDLVARLDDAQWPFVPDGRHFFQRWVSSAR